MNVSSWGRLHRGNLISTCCAASHSRSRTWAFSCVEYGQTGSDTPRRSWTCPSNTRPGLNSLMVMESLNISPLVTDENGTARILYERIILEVFARTRHTVPDLVDRLFDSVQTERTNEGAMRISPRSQVRTVGPQGKSGQEHRATGASLGKKRLGRHGRPPVSANARGV